LPWQASRGDERPGRPAFFKHLACQFARQSHAVTDL
jgi:hypothetical protein